MYISVTKPHSRSLRPYDDGTGQPLLVVCGEDHPAGDFPKEGAESCLATLEEWTRHHFPVKEITHRWSAFDYVAADKLPYIGYAHHGTKSVFTATGFMKWGHTTVRQHFPLAVRVRELSRLIVWCAGRVMLRLVSSPT